MPQRAAQATTGCEPMTVVAERKETLERLPYFGSIDGLRAVAVSSVILFHFAPSVLPAGFLGVDVFFVVSGFLISRIIVSEIGATGRLGLARFWGRRVRRLLPALATVIAVVTIGAAVWFSPFELQDVRAHALGSFAYVANWVFIAGSGSYFATIGRPSPLLHVWSLSIEEQFYVLFPLVSVLAHRGIRRRPLRAAGVAGALAVASAVWMAVLVAPGSDPSRAYLGSDAHSMGLLVGIALGFLAGSGAPWERIVTTLRRPGTARAAAAVAAVVCVAGLMTMRVADGQSRALYHGGFLVFSVAVAFVIVVVVVLPGSVPSRALASGWLVAIGLRSYSLYLWHWPVSVFLTPSSGLHGFGLFAARLACSVVLAELSYRLIERPFRVGAIARRTGSRGAIAYSVVLFGVTVALAATVAAPPRIPSGLSVGGGVEGEQSRTVLLFGDSTALVFGINAPIDEHPELRVDGEADLACSLVTTDHVSGGTVRSYPDRCRDWRQRWQADLDRFPDGTIVVMDGAWDLLDQRVNDTTVRFGTPEWDALVTASVRDATDLLSASGRPVYVFEVPCYPKSAKSDALPERADPVRVAALNGVLRRIADENPNVHVVPLREAVCDGDRARTTLDGAGLWEADGTHFTPAGARAVWRWWLERMPRS